MAVVKKIPAKPKQSVTRQNATPVRRKVAAYARVSTDRDEQFTSYTAQIDYYTRYIHARPDWEFAGMYTDGGISGTSMKYREGFKQMIADALAGKIDLIVTKSVSRFARNTVDSLTTIRKLKEHGTECYFEKENIWTFDGKGELLITIMSSLAQEESRSISENVTWGHRKRMADGRVLIAFSTFMGYKRGKNGEMVVDEAQAEVVRDIYGCFLLGMTPNGIASRLTKLGVPNCYGGDRWYDSTVQSILTNEKYKGDALMQKRYTEDFLTKKRRKNDGVLPQYYVEGDHEAIIEPETFDLVQLEIARRRELARNNAGGRYNGADLLGARIICGECGCHYGPKVWHSNTSYSKKVYRCNGKYEERSGKSAGKAKAGRSNRAATAHKCGTPHLYEGEIRQLFVDAVNALIALKGGSIDEFLNGDNGEFDACVSEAERDRQDSDMQALFEQLKAAVEENVRDAIDRERCDESAEYSAIADARYDALLAGISEGEPAEAMPRQILAALAGLEAPIEEFDEELWAALLDNVTVYSLEDIRCSFKDGTVLQLQLDASAGGVARRNTQGRAKPASKKKSSKGKTAPIAKC